nr:hypothetical protein [Tanacetum cinerariifolium]
MTGNIKLLINFVWKFLGTVHFGNDHVAAILGFVDLQASHPPKPVLNSRQRLHLLHMDLCGPIRIASINGKRYILVIVDDYSRYTWNDREEIGKLGTKGDIGFFIGYSTDSRAYRIYNRQIKKIMETMNVSFDELSEMAFEQHSSKPGLQKAMTDPAWIESMQEELIQFKRMDVWVLVPTLDNIPPLTLKWIFKNKHDEEQTVIRNKPRLVVRVYRQEEGLDFEESYAPGCEKP